MRIYELSKKLGVTNKELVDLLKQQDYEVVSHMSVLTDEAIDFLIKHFTKKSTQDSEVSPLQQEVGSDIKQQPELIRKPASMNDSHAITSPETIAQAALEQVPVSKDLLIVPMTLGDLSVKIGRPVNEIMLTLLKQGILSNKNQFLQAKVIEQLVRHYQYNPVFPSLKNKEKQEYSLHEKTSSGLK